PRFVVAKDPGVTLLVDVRTAREWLPSGELRTRDSAMVVGPREMALVYAFDTRTRDLWVGYPLSGVLKLGDGLPPVRYDSTKGVAPGRITNLRVDSADAVWAVTHSGVSRIDRAGHIRTMTADRLMCSGLDWSVGEADGSLWLHGHCGLIR